MVILWWFTAISSGLNVLEDLKTFLKILAKIGRLGDPMAGAQVVDETTILWVSWPMVFPQRRKASQGAINLFVGGWNHEIQILIEKKFV